MHNGVIVCQAAYCQHRALVFSSEFSSRPYRKLFPMVIYILTFGRRSTPATRITRGTRKVSVRGVFILQASVAESIPGASYMTLGQYGELGGSEK